MKKQLVVAMVTMLAFGTLSLHAQTATAQATTKKAKQAKVKAETSEQKAIRELQEKMAAQQSEIDELKQQNAAKDAALSAAQSSAATAQSTAAMAQSQAAAAAAQAQSAAATAQSQGDALTSVKSNVTDLQGANASLASTISSTKTDLMDSVNSPAAVHYKGITITPVAFFAFENVWRERSVNSDINTPFNTIPLPSANQGHVSELNFSGRQSRLGGLFTGDAGKFKLSGYFEGDFLGSGTTSNGNQSNSYVLRQRQFWGQAAMKSGFTLTGGQMWSLVTETGLSTNNRSEKLPNSIDAQYTVGFSWARQAGLRLQQTFGDVKKGGMATLAMSVENAQITNFAATSATSGAVPTNFFFSGAGQNGGLYNAFNGTYANNVSPDVIAKATFDLPHAHFELGGIARFMRDYYFPIVTTAASSYTYSANYTSHTSSAGGAFAGVRVSPSKYVDFAVTAMGGTGVGRYGTSQLADATLRPDGTLEPIKNYHGLFSVETHPTPKLDMYAYYGGEYAQRTVYTITAPTGGSLNGAQMGYGARNLSNAGCYSLPSNPGSATGGSPSASGCASPTRYIQEGLIGFTYRVANSPKYGRIQYQVNYQYMQRNLWSGIGSASTPTGPRGVDNMIFTGMRYYIP